MTITVGPNVNDDPVADDDTYSVAEDGTLTVPAGTGVLAGDTDVDGGPLSVTVRHGRDERDRSRSTPTAPFTYTPNADFNGTETFTYQVSDGNGGLDTGSVTITVTPVNDPPVADDDSYTMGEDGTLTVPPAPASSRATRMPTAIR